MLADVTKLRCVNLNIQIRLSIQPTDDDNTPKPQMCLSIIESDSLIQL